MSVNEAAASYDDVTRRRQGDRKSSQVAFRHFNNFVKKALIQFALDRAAALLATPKDGVTVLDLASGRGGDIGKWVYTQSPVKSVSGNCDAVVRTSVYDCYDVSTECIHEAEYRFKEMSNAHGSPLPCRASFTVADCFCEKFLHHTLRAAARFGSYHAVTIQFAFHYACRSAELMQSVLATISDAMAPGGVVLITTVDLQELSARTAQGQLRNELFSIAFPEAPQYAGETVDGVPQLAPYTKYHFKLEGFVDCPEYVVPMDLLTSAAGAVQLRVCTAMTKPFIEFVHEYAANWKLNKGNKLTDAEMELVTLYRTICLEKIRL